MGEMSSGKNGNIIIENRSKLTASSVKDVESYTPERIIIITENAVLTVTGNGMKVKKLSTESGDIFIEGEINGCVYSKDKGEKESFLRKVLK